MADKKSYSHVTSKPVQVIVGLLTLNNTAILSGVKVSILKNNNVYQNNKSCTLVKTVRTHM